MTQKPNDRRRAPRAETLLSVQLEATAYSEDTKTVDASPTGLFVATRKPLPVASVVTLRLEGGVTLKARVARVVEADGSAARTPGMGLHVLEGAEHLPALASSGRVEITKVTPGARGRAPWTPPVPALKAFAGGADVAATPATAAKPAPAAPTAPAAATNPSSAGAAESDNKKGNGKKAKKGKGGKRDLFGG